MTSNTTVRDLAENILRSIAAHCDDAAIRRWARRLLQDERAEGTVRVRGHRDERGGCRRRRGGG
jgi:hypothetical protein